MVAEYAADLDAAEVDGRAGGDGAQPLRAQRQALDGNVHLVDGRCFQRHEFPRRLPRTGPHADVGAGQQRPQAGDAARGDAGALDPELGSVAQFVFGGLLHPRGDKDIPEIVAERHGLDQAELDVPVLDRRLPRLEPGCELEGDSDRRPAFGEGRVNQPCTGDRRDDRDQPDERIKASLASESRLRQLGRRLGAVRVIVSRAI